jgi:hypothetical protein
MRKRGILALLLVAVLFLAGCAPGDLTETLYTADILPNSGSNFSIGSTLSTYLSGHFDNLHVDAEGFYMGGVIVNLSSMVGPQGPQGPAGADGSSSITVGNTSTGAEGTNASVTNSGNESYAILEFTIPRGANGSDGALGPAGPNIVNSSTATTFTGYLYGNGGVVTAKNTLVYGLCTTAAATVAKTCNISGYTPTIGDFIAINYSLGSSAAAITMNMCNTSAKAVRMNNVAHTAVFGTYTAGATILYYYDGTYYQQVASQRTTDTNTWDRISIPFALKVAVGTTRYKICLQATNDSYYPVSLEDKVTTNKNASTATFRLGGNILYYSSTTPAVANTTTTNFYSMFPNTNIHYSFNQNTSWVLNSSLYLRAIPAINATFTLNNSTNTSWFTQTLPTTEDGQIYIYLGPVYAANSMVLVENHPIYEFKDGYLRLYQANGGIHPVTMANSSAAINSIFVDSATGNLSYKDGSGVTHMFAWQ